MAKLTGKARKALPPSDFALPKERAYPVPDPAHGRNALARVAQNGTPAEKAAVKRKVAAKFPQIEQADKPAPKKKPTRKPAAKGGPVPKAGS